MFEEGEQCMYVTWLKKKKIGFRPFQQDQEMTSHKQLQHSVAQDFPKQIEEGGKILLQTHLGSQQLSVRVDFYPTAHRQPDSVHTSLRLCTSAPVHPEAVC